MMYNHMFVLTHNLIHFLRCAPAFPFMVIGHFPFLGFDIKLFFTTISNIWEN